MEAEIRGKAKILCMCLDGESDGKVEGVFRPGDDYSWHSVLFHPDEPFVCPACEVDDNWGFDEAEPVGVEDEVERLAYSERSIG